MWLKQCHKPPICYGLYHPFMVFFLDGLWHCFNHIRDFDLTSHSPSAASEGEDDGLYMVYQLAEELLAMKSAAFCLSKPRIQLGRAGQLDGLPSDGASDAPDCLLSWFISSLHQHI